MNLALPALIVGVKFGWVKGMGYRLSSSTLGLFKECPRCFWLHFRKGIKRPMGIFPSLPSGMDKILKAHFDSFMEKGLLPPELKELNGRVKLFDDPGQLRVWRNNFKGIKWVDAKGNVLRGAIDNILVKGNKLIVLDYKTRGYPLKENTADYYQDQLDIYNFLLKKNGFKTENYSYLLFYHPLKVNQKGNVVFNTDLVKVSVSTKNARKLFQKALDTLKHSMPKPSKDCEYCKWVKKCPPLQKNQPQTTL